MNYEGPITIRATSTGTDSTLAGIGRLVADAQAREAPVQRLADAVAGKFCYSVMAASAATFAFWSLAGASHYFSVLQFPAPAFSSNTCVARCAAVACGSCCCDGRLGQSHMLLDRLDSTCGACCAAVVFGILRVLHGSA